MKLDSIQSFSLFQPIAKTEDISFLCPIKTKVEDVLLKIRMRESFMSGSVRGLIVTSEPILQYEVDYEPYSTILEGSKARVESHNVGLSLIAAELVIRVAGLYQTLNG